MVRVSEQRAGEGAATGKARVSPKAWGWSSIPRCGSRPAIDAALLTDRKMELILKSFQRFIDRL
jgi:hypothetical protein